MRLLRHAVILAAIVASVHVVDAQQMQGQWPSIDEIRAMLLDAAAQHGAPAQQLLAVVNCESSFRPWVIGGHGERGIGQFLPGRGNAWRLTSYARDGIEIVDLYRRGDPDALAIEVDGLAQIFAQHPAAVRNEWYTCSRRS